MSSCPPEAEERVVFGGDVSELLQVLHERANPCQQALRDLDAVSEVVVTAASLAGVRRIGGGGPFLCWEVVMVVVL